MDNYDRVQEAPTNQNAQLESGTESSNDIQERPESDYQSINVDEIGAESESDGNELSGFEYDDTQPLILGVRGNSPSTDQTEWDRASYYDTASHYAKIDNWCKKKWMELKEKFRQFRPKENNKKFMTNNERTSTPIGFIIVFLVAFALGILADRFIISRQSVEQQGTHDGNLTKTEGNIKHFLSPTVSVKPI